MFKNIKNFFDTAKKIEADDQDYLDEDIFAVLSLLIEASKIDGIVSSDEIKLIKNILVNKFHLNSEKADKAIKFVIQKSDEKIEMYSDVKIILDNMDHNERVSVIEMMWKIILADGKIDDYESNLIRRICGLLHVTGTESSEAKKRALSL
tara:strand:+ start:91 stop:540 length:450 start_codon:yes stop_codon:yes gene_type:complete